MPTLSKQSTAFSIKDHSCHEMNELLNSLHHALGPIDFIDKLEEEEEELMFEKYNSNIFIVEVPSD